MLLKMETICIKKYKNKNSFVIIIQKNEKIDFLFSKNSLENFPKKQVKTDKWKYLSWDALSLSNAALTFPHHKNNNHKKLNFI